MINANVDNVADALRVGHDFKKSVNELIETLEIDIDNIFRRILLQAREEVRAQSTWWRSDGKCVEKMEVKGLGHEASRVLQLCRKRSPLGSSMRFSRATRRNSPSYGYHEYLREIAGKMREQAIPVQKYIIFTQLGKALTEYPNIRHRCPRSRSALRDISSGQDGPAEATSSRRSSPATARVLEPAPEAGLQPSHDVLKKHRLRTPTSSGTLGKQIFPPVERLCANITGTSAHPNSPSSSGSTSGRYNTSHIPSGCFQRRRDPPSSRRVADAVRFQDCDAPPPPLPRPARSLPRSRASLTPPARVSAKRRHLPGCGATVAAALRPPSPRVEHAVRTHTTRYYERLARVRRLIVWQPALAK